MNKLIAGLIFGMTSPLFFHIDDNSQYNDTCEQKCNNTCDTYVNNCDKNDRKCNANCIAKHLECKSGCSNLSNKDLELNASKAFCCSGATSCKEGSTGNENSCQAPRVLYGENSASDAVERIRFNCEAALNIGGSGCKDGGYCCNKGSVECEEKPSNKDCP